MRICIHVSGSEFADDASDCGGHRSGGNIWFINIWKPDLDIDTQSQNPGGDGLIIFGGLAAPTTTQVH